jgi:hypothetical protein
MLARIALFELRYQLRRPIALVSFLVFAAIAFGLVSMYGVIPGIAVPVNGPTVIAISFSSLSILAMFLSLAGPADVALRDGETRMDAILRAQPIRTSVHFGARFAGAYAVACLAFLGAVLGHALAAIMPWMLPNAVGPFRPETYAIATMVIALPTLFATSALFFAVATLTRRLMATYLSAVVLLMLFIVTQYFMASPAYRALAALLDPFGLYAFIIDTLHWTNADRSVRPIPLDGPLMWNRLLWIGIGGLLLVLSFTLFSARERRPRTPRLDHPTAAPLPVMRERPSIAAGGAGMWDQLVVRTRHETRSIIRSWTFHALLILGLLFAVGVLLAQTLAGTMPDPATHLVVRAIAVAFGLIATLVPIVYGGQLVWRDRKAKIAEIIDATPAPSAVLLTSKIAAVALVILALLAAAMASGIVFQLVRGASEIAVSSYLITLILLIGLPALMFGVLAIFIQTVVNQKLVGLLLMLVVLILVAVADAYGINKLVVLFEIPDVPLTEINLSYFVIRSLWYAGYWTCVSVLIAVATYLIWVRGNGSLWVRIRRAHLAVTPAVVLIAVMALAGAAGIAGYIHWEGGSQDSVAPTSEPLQATD